jgi:uncharacterized protein with GYD domain
MPTYIMLSRFTQQGLERIKDSPGRLEAAKQTLKGLGAELKDFYLLMGQYDVIVVVEAPDEETMTKAALAIGSRGAIRTETLRAFTEDEYRDLIGSLP